MDRHERPATRQKGVTRGRPEPLRVELLGGFRVSIGSRTIEKKAWRLRKAASLVKLLALAPGHRLHREQAMDLLWPELGMKAANSLRQTLHAARAALSRAEGSRYLASEAGMLVLCPEGGLRVDAEVFEAAASNARHSRDPAAYRAAVELYAGDLLPEDRYEQWAEEKRVALRAVYLALLTELATLYEQRGEYSMGVEILQRAVAEEPAYEEANASLMRMYAVSGRRGEALSQYGRLRESLSRELGAEPGAATIRLREEISAGRLPLSQGADRTPQGSSTGNKHNLPAERTSFIGREREMLEIKRALAMTRLLTLAGTGGSGKTRLALEVARSLIGAYQDGVWLVELAGLSEESLVPQAVAGVLRVPERSGQPLVDTLAETLRSMRMLLVLDNCEHVVQAVALLVDALLDSCPHLLVLATSREALEVAGEVRWPVPALSVPDPSQRPTLGELEGYESARLFAERARRRDPSFSLTSGNAQSVAEICARVDGLPLPIELAAARVGTLGVAQISERLGDALGLLTDGGRTTVSRQRTLRGAMDWSHELLSADEKQLFRRLSVFAGGWTLEAAESVGAGDGIEKQHVLDLLSALVDKSLVVAEAESTDVVRYRFLEPVRQYAREKLDETQEAEGIRHRHAGHFLAVAEVAEPGLRGPEAGEWLHRLGSEHDNVRAALAWALAGNDPGLGLRLAAVFWRFWGLSGYLSEGSSWLREALSKGSNSAGPGARARALNGLGTIVGGQGDFEQAEAYQEEACTLYEQVDSQTGLAESLSNLGWLVFSRGDAGRAADIFEKGLAAARESANKDSMPRVLNGLAAIAFDSGEPERAIHLWEDALAIDREQGNHIETAVVLTHMGFAEIALGNYERSATLAEEALALGHKLNISEILAGSLLCKGLTATLQGDPERAESMLAESLAINVELEITANIVEDLEVLATTAGALEQHARAARLWGAAKTMRAATGTAWGRMDRVIFEAPRDATRSRLGETAWEMEFAAGKAMTFEEAIEYALSEAECTAPSTPDVDPSSFLSHREKEVATLVSQGLTNRRIAGELFVSERTVEHHVASILKKLGIHSREQVASRLGGR